MYLGIDIGGTKCAVSIGDNTGKIYTRESFLTNEPLGPEQSISKLLETAEKLVHTTTHKIKAIGVSCGSPMNSQAGIILSPPNLPSWKEVPITKIFSDKFQLPTFLENDANACALAEYLYGAGQGYSNIVFITFGTGCGAGLILDKKLYRGSNGFAGEVGHLRLTPTGPVGYHKAGSMEGYCSGGGLAQLAIIMRPTFNGPTNCSATPTAEELGNLAKQGDAFAIQVFEQSGFYLGQGLALILDLLNPERIIIGSIYSRCEQLLRPKMLVALKQEALSYTSEICEIVPAGLGEKGGDLAAISIADYHLRNL